MKLLSFQLFLGLFFFLSLAWPTFAQEQFYFNDEFNQERPANILDPNKWITYPNKRTTPSTTGCMFDTINENGGFLHLKQCEGTSQFPYVTSKNNPIPSGNFTATVRFKYVNTTAQGNGIQFIDKAPDNGAGYTNLFGLGTWETGASGATQATLYITYKNIQAASFPADFNYHEFKVERENDVYKLYLDNQLYFTSPPTNEKVEAVYFGDPSIQNPLYDWNQLWVDYIRIKNDGPSQSTPQPFLELPWDHQSMNMSFSEAATSINSYFDHEYPFLSTSIYEPSQLIPYYENSRSAKPYSSHDGYDYGALAKTKLDTPQLAAADGEATFMSQNTCWACGNAILVDHKNGFQTRYYHLQSAGLITNQVGVKVNVLRGQQIGKTGYTGNVIPRGKPEGAHIHFMVVQDKNNDGNFEDNIPDGLVDPFGWQSDTPDPWENYSFFYNGQQRTGNKSYYLFTKKLDNLNASLTSNAAVFNIGKTKLEFPQGTTGQSLNLTANSAPNFTSNLLNSLGSILKVEAKNSAGQLISNFLKNFNLTIDFSQFDLNRYNPDTLSIFSSQDGQNWTKENSTIDLQNKTATTSINHLTYFAVMAERKDTLSPTTTPVLDGSKGKDNNFRSDVSLNLNTVDNLGGLGVEFTAWGYEDQPWQTYSTPLSFSEEGTYKIFFYSQDKDDNIEEIKSVEFLIDKTPPVITAKATVEGNEYTPHTWTNKDVSINFSCTDDSSGVSEITESTTISTEGSNQEIFGSCSDRAGNTSETKFTGINIDKTAPTIKLSADPNILWPPNSAMVDVKLSTEIVETNLSLKTFNIADEYDLIEPAISDLNQIIKLEASRKGDDLDGRVYTIKVIAEDLAGNNSEAQVQVIVPHDRDDKKLLDSRF